MLRTAFRCFVSTMLVGLAAGATTLIVALGILPRPVDFVFLMAAVFPLTLFALVVNRANGIAFPSGGKMSRNFLV